jgi:hypothetical protein
MPNKNVIEVTSLAEFDKLIKDTKKTVTIVDFSATWYLYFNYFYSFLF